MDAYQPYEARQESRLLNSINYIIFDLMSRET